MSEQTPPQKPVPAQPVPRGDATPPPVAPVPSEKLTPEEQMERFAKELKENDWGHQPC